MSMVVRQLEERAGPAVRVLRGTKELKNRTSMTVNSRRRTAVMLVVTRRRRRTTVRRTVRISEEDHNSCHN